MLQGQLTAGTVQNKRASKGEQILGPGCRGRTRAAACLVAAQPGHTAATKVPAEPAAHGRPWAAPSRPHSGHRCVAFPQSAVGLGVVRSGTLQSSPIDTLVPPVTGLVPPVTVPVPPVTDLDSEAPGLLFLEKETELAGWPALPALPADGRAASSGLVAELTARSSKGVPKPHAVKMPGFSISQAIHLTHGLWVLGFESGPVVLSQGPFSPGDARPYLETPPVITLRGAGG